MAERPKRPPDILKKAGGDLLERGADAAVKHGLAGWWARADETQKTAVTLVSAAAALGPLGQGILATLGILFAAPELPSAKQLYAVAWLLAITLPVAAFAVVCVVSFGKAPTPAVLAVAGICSVAGAAVMTNSGIPEQLAGVYCYADFQDGPVYEEQCREFNAEGFIAENARNVGSPSRSPGIFASAVAYTADARGTVMVVASLMASIGIGMLIRRRFPG